MNDLPTAMTEDLAEFLLANGVGRRDGDRLMFDPDEVWEHFPHVLMPLPVQAVDVEIHERLGTPAPEVYFVSKEYQVALYLDVESDGWPEIAHLSCKRRDREPIDENRWRILQALKNAICGPECEGVELYPAESRLVDTANQYHLWVLPEGVKLPFGFQTRLVGNEGGGGAKQRTGSSYDDADDEKLNAALEAVKEFRNGR